MYKIVSLILLTVPFFTLADTSTIHLNEKVNSPIRSIIHTDDPTTSTVSKEEFYQIINDTFSLYNHLVGNDGKSIEIGIQDWETPYLSAWAHDNGTSLTVNYWGGYARVNGTTELSFALTACHEMGHLVGGEPTHTHRSPQPMMSAEGQADYFAARECLKNYLNHFNLRYEVHLDPKVASMCHTKFKESSSQIDNKLNEELCYQVIQAGIDISHVFAHLARTSVPDPLIPSEQIVKETLFNGYPSIQCRLDTYISGALSIYPPSKNETEQRPLCWFKSKKI